MHIKKLELLAKKALEKDDLKLASDIQTTIGKLDGSFKFAETIYHPSELTFHRKFAVESTEEIENAILEI